MYRLATTFSVIPRICAVSARLSCSKCRSADELAIKGVQRVEGFLDPEHHLGPHRRLGGRSELPQQHRGQGGRARLGERIEVERDLLADVAHLGPEVAAVGDGQSLGHDQPQPEERRQVRP